MKSHVYFAKTEIQDVEQRTAALKKILDKTTPFLRYDKGEHLPVKITIGDSSCVYNVSPEFVKRVISRVKEGGAKPFLFDTSVIYEGQRQNAVDHLNLVQSKGFGHSRVGAPFVVADGVFGQDGKEFNINSENIKKIKIPSFVDMVDSLLVLSHSTGHIVSGYAGAIKNVAMGMSCRATKQVQHSSLKPVTAEDRCVSCGRCIEVCPVKAMSFNGEKKAFIDKDLCLGCGECLCACKFDAVLVNWQEDSLVFARRLAETASFILSKFKKKFFITFAFDITKECDCISAKHEEMISSDLGILASEDPLSIDKAAVDLALQNGSPFLLNARSKYEEIFKRASRCKMGNLDYELITL